MLSYFYVPLVESRVHGAFDTQGFVAFRLTPHIAIFLIGEEALSLVTIKNNSHGRRESTKMRRRVRRASRLANANQYDRCIRLLQRTLVQCGSEPASKLYELSAVCLSKLGGFPKGSAAEEAQTGAVDKYLVLKALHEKINPKLYLEIGVQSGKSLMLAQTTAIGIDPMPVVSSLPDNCKIVQKTSDAFFNDCEAYFAKQKIDLSFIDGMHTIEAVLKDFINVEKHSYRTSVVVIDDVLPNHWKQAERKRCTRAWTGDVWKIYDLLSLHRPDLHIHVIDAGPTGILIVSNLDPNNRLLEEQFCTFARRSMKDARPPPSVLLRTNAAVDYVSVIESICDWRRSNALP